MAPPKFMTLSMLISLGFSLQAGHYAKEFAHLISFEDHSHLWSTFTAPFHKWGQREAKKFASAIQVAGNRATPLSNSDPKPLFPALCVAEYQGHEHCFIVRKLLGLSQPQEHLWGPSGECFLGGLTDLTIWLPLNPVQSLEKLPLTRGPAAFYSKSFMCGTKH